MKCKSCNQEISDTSVLCSYCGQPTAYSSYQPLIQVPARSADISLSVPTAPSTPLAPSTPPAPSARRTPLASLDPSSSPVLLNQLVSTGQSIPDIHSLPATVPLHYQVRAVSRKKNARVMFVIIAAVLALVGIMIAMAVIISYSDAGFRPSSPPSNNPRTADTRLLTDNSYVTITFTGGSYKSRGGTDFNVIIENKSEKNLRLAINEVQINGSSDEYAEIFDDIIPPGKTYEGFVYLEKISDLTEMINMTGMLHVFDSESLEVLESYPIAYSYRVSI